MEGRFVAKRRENGEWANRLQQQVLLDVIAGKSQEEISSNVATYTANPPAQAGADNGGGQDVV